MGERASRPRPQENLAVPAVQVDERIVATPAVHRLIAGARHRVVLRGRGAVDTQGCRGAVAASPDVLQPDVHRERTTRAVIADGGRSVRPGAEAAAGVAGQDELGILLAHVPLGRIDRRRPAAAPTIQLARAREPVLDVDAPPPTSRGGRERTQESWGVM